MTIPEFRDTLAQWDVVLLQETFLRPGQENQLELPRGFQCQALSRVVADDFSQQGGGLLVLYRDTIPVRNVTPPSETEVMLLRIGDILLANIYIPPPQSPWLAHSSTPPIEHLLECLQPALAEDTPVILLGDFNARVGCLTAGLLRTSPDPTANTRGRQVVELCSDLSLQILNGTATQSRASLPRFTSFQPGGTSVIDLALVSESLLASQVLSAFEICDHAKDWSDHAALSLTVRVAADLVRDLPRRRSTRARTRVPKPLLSSKIDDALRDTLLPLRNKLSPLASHYGSPWMNGRPLQVYLSTAVSDPDSQRPTTRAGAGLYWGPNNEFNTPVATGGAQSSSRVAIAAAALAVLTADHTRELRIHTDSEFLIRATCHWAPQNAREGWKCPHADLLQPLDKLLRERPAPVAFYLRPRSPDLVGAHATAAADLARGALAKAPCLLDYTVLEPPPHWPARPPPLAHDISDSARHPTTSAKVRTPLHDLSTIVEPLVRGDNLGSLDAVQWDVAGFGSVPVLAKRKQNVDKLLNAPSDGAFWTAFQALIRDKHRTVPVAADELKDVFEVRMNPPHVLPAVFDPMTHAVNRAFAQSLPPRTKDTSANLCFSRAFTVEEIDDVKAHIRTHCKGSARGDDGIGYDDVLSLDSENLRSLFQACIDSGDAPAAWVTAIIAAIKKPGKDGSLPESYRTIGLESCLLKTLTLLIDRRLREWAEGEGQLPDSQSGFRKGQRTSNNAYILRVAIEKARALRRPLYVVFLDLTNAFPSVDQPTLWTKLMERGAAGPLLDWLRMLYTRLLYVVRFQGEVTESFRALAGILTGDPASPILWDIFLADFHLAPHDDDIFIGDRRISHLELADDIALLSLSAAGMQSKLDQFEDYCATSFLLVNVSKTVAMIHGPLPNPLPTLLLYGEALAWSAEAAYVGMTFQSTARYIFARNYALKAATARNVASVTFSVEGYMGRLPALAASKLYRARVDPHLTAGCEVAIDICATSLDALERVQHKFLRRALGLGSHTQLAPLFTETGIWPIRYRRLNLALRYLQYVLRDAPPLPAAAFMEAWRLTANGFSSWWGDLYHALRALPVPVYLTLREFPTVLAVDALLLQLEQSLADSLHAGIMASERLPLLRTRTLAARSSDLADLCTKRNYLSLRSDRLRNAMTRLHVSDHPLAIEELRRHRPPVPRARRICRFCKKRWAVEDECHVLIECTGEEVEARRALFWEDATALLPKLAAIANSLSTPAALDMLLTREKTMIPLAEFVADVFDLCDNVPCFIVADDDALLALAL